MTFVALTSEPLTVTPVQSYFHAHHARSCGFTIESPFTPNLVVERMDMEGRARIVANTVCCNADYDGYAARFGMRYRCAQCQQTITVEVFPYFEHGEVDVWVESLVYPDLNLNVFELDLTVQTLTAKIHAVVEFARSLPLGLEASDPVLARLDEYMDRFAASQSENVR